MSTLLAIQAKNISYRYANNDYYSLSDISLAIPQGQCVGIIGPNGAGKSTLISILCGLISPQQGVIQYFPHNEQSETLSLQKNIEKSVALIPQEYAFYPELTVKQNLEYFIALNKNKGQKSKLLLSQSIQQCDLESVRDQKSAKLSGGYKRRLNIAIALSKSPEIIFLDEPTVGIDPVSRHEIINLLKSLKAQGKTLIYTSHMLNEVEQLCDKIILLQQGREIAATNTLDDKMFLNIEIFNTAPNLIEKLKLIATEPQQTSFQIEVNDLDELQQKLSFFNQHLEDIKSLHFSKNSIEQLYFNSYKASSC